MSKAVVESIGNEYEGSIKPIFQKSCFDCHSSYTRYPWYSSLPFAKDQIEKDITEARKHLDFTSGYPFKGHGTLVSDLESIRDSIVEGTMPPKRYTFLHWSATLSQDEKDAIIQWAERSLGKIKKAQEGKKSGNP